MKKKEKRRNETKTNKPHKIQEEIKKQQQNRRGSLRCIHLCPSASSFVCFALVVFPNFSNFWVERIFNVWLLKEKLQRQAHGADLLSWRPIGFQDVKANAADAINVGVINFGHEPDFGRLHGVILGEEKFEFEDSTLKRSARRAFEQDVEVTSVVFVRGHRNVGDWILAQPLSLFDDSFAQCHFETEEKLRKRQRLLEKKARFKEVTK
jgi:hypothetical protein